MSEQDERSVGRGILALLAVGAALGLAYNQLALGGHPPRGIPWRAARPALAPLVPVPADTTRTLPRDTTRAAAPAAPPTHASPAAAAPRTTSPPPPRAPGGAAPPPDPAPAAVAAPDVPERAEPMEAKLETVKRLFDARGAIFLDARDAAEYGAGHVPGAIPLTYNDVLVDAARLAPLRSDGRPIVAYCGGGTCEASADLARVLVENGFRRVLVFSGGWPEWAAAGYPVEAERK